MLNLMILFFALSISLFAFSQQSSPPSLYSYTEENVLTLFGANQDWLKGNVFLDLRSDNNKYEGKPLEIFENPLFNSKPVYLLTAEGITEGEKETKFQKIVESNKSPNEFFQVPEYDFITLSRSGTSIGLKGNDFNSKYIQIVHKNKKYFLKNSEDLLKYLKKYPYFFEYNSLFIDKTRKAELDQKLNQVSDFKKFIVALKECVIAKDQECLYNYVDEYTAGQDLEKDHYRNIFLVRQILDDPNLCDDWNKTR